MRSRLLKVNSRTDLSAIGSLETPHLLEDEEIFSKSDLPNIDKATCELKT
jgi:hypothetical protein